MMQAYVDDSGRKGQSPVLAFSALISGAERMARLATDWQDVLDESPRIQYFKMDEAESCNGEFYGFSGPERDTKLRRFCGLLATDELTEFSYMIPFSAFDQTLGSRSGRPLSEPYFFPFHATIVGIASHLHWQGEREPFEIFFDDDVIFGPRAKAWYPVARATCIGTLIFDLLPAEPFFRDDKTTVVLQAADLCAWVRRKSNSPELLGEFDWLPSALQGLRHSPLSRKFSPELGEAILDKNRTVTPEQARIRKAAIDAYRETFGHEWPPRTKQELRQARGRIKKKR